MLNKSKELKAERGYVEPDSFVRLDGSEVLVKQDWTRRKAELWERSGGKCEYHEPTIVHGVSRRCVSEAADPHHVSERWRKRDDRLFNLMAVCRFHHILLDQRKIGGRK